MTAHELVVLLPCHALEDFPFYHEGAAAADLLACYTTLWHPALVAQARQTPTWKSAYDPAEGLAGRLVLLPRACRDDLPGYWTDEAAAQGALVLESSGEESRDELVAKAMQLLALSDADQPTATLPVTGQPALLADFFALGLCNLLLELLTLQMRYTSLVDQEHFSRQLVAAAEASISGDEAVAHEKLGACFDALHESRGHFYPVDSYLVDLTLVAPTTIGPSLRTELGKSVPLSLLLGGSTLEVLAEREPATLAALKSALAAETVSLVGGEAEEEELPLLPPERVLGNFKRGLGLYERWLGARPTIFGRRRFGLSPMLPQLLDNLGFSSALHCTLDDGRFPQSRQSMCRWEGRGSVAIDALCRVPLDASRPETILTLPQQIGSAMDMDHVAVVVFAHWPGRTTPWYEDLRHCAAYTPVLGRFVTLQTLFNDADVPGQLTSFAADEYRPPYLSQQVAAGESDPIARSVSIHQEQAAQDAADTLDTLTALLSGAGQTGATGDSTTSLDDAVGRFANALPQSSSSTADGYLVVNPLSFTRRVVVDANDLARPPVGGSPIYAAGEANGRREVVVDVPPLGYAWIAAGAEMQWAVPAGKPLAEGHVLRNESFEISINPTTGGIQSVYTPGYRGNRLSQQLALRQPPSSSSRPTDSSIDSHEVGDYSVMAADSVEVTAGPCAAEAVSRGRLLDNTGKPLATFRQTTRVERGSPVIAIEIELQPAVELAADPWNHYFAARFAWSDDAIELHRDAGMVAEATKARRLETPHYVEIRGDRVRTAILTGGLPYHRRVGPRGLDTLLAVRGDTARRFRLGVALDMSHPQLAAMELLTPATIVRRTAPPPVSAASWLFHIDVKNVVATHWEPRISDGRVIGLRVRLLETMARAGRCGLHSFRPIAAARTVDFLGRPLSELQPSGDKVMIDMSAGEWTEVEIDWP